MHSNNNRLAEAIFVAKVAARELSSGHAEPAVLYHDLVALVSGREPANSAVLMTKINANLSLRRQYTDMVTRFGFAHSPAFAAASTTSDLPTRQTEQFNIKFKRDALVPNQIFALLNITHPNDSHYQQPVVVNVFNQQHCERIAFPPLIEGLSQCLFDEDDKQLQLLLDVDAQISIMP